MNNQNDAQLYKLFLKRSEKLYSELHTKFTNLSTLFTKELEGLSEGENAIISKLDEQNQLLTKQNEELTKLTQTLISSNQEFKTANDEQQQQIASLVATVTKQEKLIERLNQLLKNIN